MRSEFFHERYLLRNQELELVNNACSAHISTFPSPVTNRCTSLIPVVRPFKKLRSTVRIFPSELVRLDGGSWVAGSRTGHLPPASVLAAGCRPADFLFADAGSFGVKKSFLWREATLRQRIEDKARNTNKFFQRCRCLRLSGAQTGITVVSMDHNYNKQ